MLKVIDRNELHWMIDPGSRVLDVGSGDEPFRSASVLVDRLPRQIQVAHGVFNENAGFQVRCDGRPLVIADIENLPFIDDSFDFVYASHVIEHVSSPGRALRELVRISKRGYLECPRSWFEFVDSSPFHKWLIDFEEGMLVFRPKPKKWELFCGARRLFDVDRTLFLQFYGDVGASRSKAEMQFGPNKGMCHLCLYYEGSIPFRIADTPEV